MSLRDIRKLTGFEIADMAIISFMERYTILLTVKIVLVAIIWDKLRILSVGYKR